MIQDGYLTTGVENYKEFFQSLVGLSGESQNFDGNGQYTRFQTGGGDHTVVQTGAAGRRRPAVRQRHSAAARHPPGAPRASRRRTSRTAPATSRRRPNLNAAQIGGGP